VLDRSFGADEALTSRVRIHANYDICLIGSQTATPHYAEAFGQPPERFVSRLGIPRTDLFSDADATARAAAQVRQRYGLPPNRRVVLYAPTFRGERVTRARHSEELDLGELRRELGDGFVLLVRQHPFVRSASPIGAQLAGFAFDVSDHPDINELMLVSDILVTDYSSAIFEYSLLERPMAFFAPDLDAYERERGFYFDYRSGVPGPVFTETRELASWLRNGPVDLERVRRFRDASFEVADGRASRRFVERIVLPACSIPAPP
jgi:CDP-ribitol ribitolphosphotransferase